MAKLIYTWVLRSLIAGMGCFWILTLLIHVYPASVGIFAAVAGRRAVCGLGESLNGVSGHVSASAAAKEINIASRLVRQDPKGFHLWETPDGAFWIPAGSDAVLPLLLAQQRQEIYGHVRPREIVLDCGAHVGVYTRRALDAGAKLVVAVEPAPDNLECLRRNFAHELAEGRVIVYPKAVWNRPGEMILHTVTHNSAGDSLVFDYRLGKEFKVPLTTIDRLTAELDLDRVDRIKLDIKGAERQALQGAVETLHKHKPRLAIAAEHYVDDWQKLPQLVQEIRRDYSVRCGPSCYMRDFWMYPETLLFE